MANWMESERCRCINDRNRRMIEKQDHTDNDDRSDHRNERNISQRTFESVSMQMLFEAIAPNTCKTRDQNTRHQHVSDGHKNWQRRHEEWRQHRHHKEQRPQTSPNLIDKKPTLRHHLIKPLQKEKEKKTNPTALKSSKNAPDWSDKSPQTKKLNKPMWDSENTVKP